MSLVVAQEKRGIISAVSDTGVMRHGVKLPWDQEVPKLCILHPDLAIGFAGDPDLGLRISSELGSLSTAAYGAVVDFALRRHIDLKLAVDILLLFNKPSRIVRIRNGRASSVAHFSWIGDKDAFEAFQKYKSIPGGPNVSSIFEKPLLFTPKESESNRDNKTFHLLGTMRYVLLDPEIQSVFGRAVAINNVDRIFEYRPFTFVLDTNDNRLAVPQSFARRVQPELMELRNYSEACGVTESKDKIQGILYHYAFGKLTYIFWSPRPCVSWQIRKVEGQNISEIVEATQKEFGVTWHGTLALSAPPPGYGIPREQWRISVQGKPAKLT